MVRVLGSISGDTKFLRVAMGLERGPVSLVRTNEELLERKVAAPVYKTEINGHGCSAALTTRLPTVHKSWH
jgi:hypothetical protein